MTTSTEIVRDEGNGTEGNASAVAQERDRRRGRRALGAVVAIAALWLTGCAEEDPESGSDDPDGGLITSGAPAHADLGQGDGKDVITMGDSYMLLALTGIQVSLERISGRDYRNYAFPGTQMLTPSFGILPTIPTQYDDAKAENPNIKTVIMTGGGNDVLMGGCTGDCKSVVDMVSARMDELHAQMGADGVEDVILVSYGYPSDEARHASLDYSRKLLPTKCTKNNKPRCHFIDPVQQLAGKISSDGIHPTDEGYDILGQLVWDLMQAEGMRR